MKQLYSRLLLICVFATVWIAARQNHNVFDIQQLFHNQPAIDLFSPEDNIRQVLIDLIGKEKKSIKIAMYYLIDPKILEALEEAIEARNVSVDIIVDPTCPEKALETLYPVTNTYIYNIKSGIMHHKFILFTGLKVLGEGSYNFTYSAQHRNRENFSFYHAVKKNNFCLQKYKNFSKRFDKLLKNATEYEPGRMMLQEECAQG
ncbi:MAG TPA: phospholipase D-like domain-containing protein [Candidatus Babeliales bacterium]|nr:phospholipase D-like domain-containing protein [Candidatus Babeliales bacterium]